jgi:hypothetical protein
MVNKMKPTIGARIATTLLPEDLNFLLVGSTGAGRALGDDGVTSAGGVGRVLAAVGDIACLVRGQNTTW